jgi:hypothetical protein
MAIAALTLMTLALAGMAWLREHPEHNPWAPLSLDDPPGWATTRKLIALRSDARECRAVLERSGIAIVSLPPAGAGACLRSDRVILPSELGPGVGLRPAAPQATCAVAAGLALWLRRGVQPAASEFLGSRVAAIEHFGTHSCRRLYGAAEGGWSEHATGNAIDVTAFVLADGRRIAVRSGWTQGGAEGAFLHAAHKSACGAFGTALGPDYNAAHADHFHLDQAGGRIGWSVCR